MLISRRAPLRTYYKMSFLVFDTEREYQVFIIFHSIEVVVLALVVNNFYTWYRQFRNRKGYFYKGILVAILTLFITVIFRISCTLDKVSIILRLGK